MTIKQIQLALLWLGYSPGQPDGQNGPKTMAAVKAFQQDQGLLADGMAGLETIRALKEAMLSDLNAEPEPEAETDDIVIPYPLIDGHYHIPKGANIRVSRNFTSSEWDCHGVGCCTTTIISLQSIKNAQGIRDRAKSPVTITSGFRCPIHNGSPSVGGATKSKHMDGGATDIVVAGHTPREIARDAEDHGILGIGLYEGQDNFVHVDDRTSKSFWFGHAQAYRSTFK